MTRKTLGSSDQFVRHSIARSFWSRRGIQKCNGDTLQFLPNFLNFLRIFKNSSDLDLNFLLCWKASMWLKWWWVQNAYLLVSWYKTKVFWNHLLKGNPNFPLPEKAPAVKTRSDLSTVFLSCSITQRWMQVVATPFRERFHQQQPYADSEHSSRSESCQHDTSFTVDQPTYCPTILTTSRFLKLHETELKFPWSSLPSCWTRPCFQVHTSSLILLVITPSFTPLYLSSGTKSPGHTVVLSAPDALKPHRPLNIKVQCKKKFSFFLVWTS